VLLKKYDEKCNINKKTNVDNKLTSNNSNSSLKIVVRGMAITILGTIVSIPLTFCAKIILARFFTQSEYGTFSLSFSIINIMVVLSLLGLDIGSTRQIAYYRGKDKFVNIKGIINSSIQISIISSFILSLIILITSDFLSTKVFHDLALSFPLKIFAIAIPFITILNVLISIYIGFDRMEEKVFFVDFLRNILFFILLLPVIFFVFSIRYAVIAFSTSYIATVIVLVVYMKIRFPYSLKNKNEIHPIPHMHKELLLFSIPLLTMAIFQSLLIWTDTLMLGAMKTTNEVGLYNAAHPISDFITIPMGALLLIYAPIITALYAKGSFTEISRNYYILTKWIFFISLPIFLVIFLFPQVFLNFLFGSNYIFADVVLQILALGILIISLFGPNGTTLVAFGETKFLMWAGFSATLMNVILNALLIPSMSIIGASIATTISIAFQCTIRQWKVHSLLKIDPMIIRLLKPTVISVSLILIIGFLVRTYIAVTFWMLPLFFILITFVILLVIILTKSIDKEDIMMILEIEKKIGINLSPIKKILNKFL
jgi:O-antigen/teichoic acid export membrane protein